MKSVSAVAALIALTLFLFSPADRLRAESGITDSDAQSAVHLAANRGDKSVQNPSKAAQFVGRALAAEARGDSQARSDLLREAISVDPSYAPAHWHSGEVRLEGRWMPIDAAVSATVNRGTMDKYRQLRNRMAGTPNAHIKLANWCAKVGLKDQERTHLTYATYLQPSEKRSREIASRLGLVRYRGLLMLEAQADALKRQTIDGRSFKRERSRLIANIKQNLAGRDPGVSASVFNELRTTPNPLKVAVLEGMLQRDNLPADVAEEGVAILAAELGNAGTDALVRQAVFSQNESTRRAAAEALRTISYFAYVPTLVGALHSPVKVQYQAYWLGNVPRHELFMYQEGPHADYVFASSGAGGQHTDVTTHVISRQPTDVTVTVTPDRTLDADALRAQQALAWNEAHAFLNQRIGAALNVATGNDFDDVPQWWSWWNDYNEMYQPPYKPLQTQVIAIPADYSIHVRNVSCFVAGTPVWTLTGPMPIEQVRLGESVLAQDPDSGELAYKPVFATTVRPPSTTIEIKTDKATIRATKGHPFWVDGIGWQMAKELKAGQNLHSPRGPIQIQSVSQHLEAECFNLVVADFNSYFVSDAQVLVHDNNLREVTTAIVPGLLDH